MKLFPLLIIPLLSMPALTAEFQETVSVEMVQVYMSATDVDRRFVTDLRAEELVVKEDGSVQAILEFTNFSNAPDANSESTPPLTIALSMDISGSMSGLSKNKEQKITIAKKAAMSLVDELRPADRMTVFGFHHLPKIIVPMTSDKALIKQKITSQNPEAQETALFDSLWIILDQLKQEQGRKIVVLGSDGVDTSSHVKLENLLEALKGSNVTLLAFGMDSLDPSVPDRRYVLDKLAEASGGYAFYPKDEKDLMVIMNNIRRIIRSQYLIWYRPTRRTKEGEWRKIDITCSRPDVQLRYRKGYYATRSENQSAASD